MKKDNNINAQPRLNPESSMIDAFQQMQNKNDMAEVMKELFDEKKIYLIGDLTKSEIKIATRIYMIAQIKEVPIWEKGLQFYIKLMLSHDRKSRREILEAIKGYSNNQGLLNKLNPFNKNQGMR